MKTILALFCLLFLSKETFACRKLLQSLGRVEVLSHLVQHNKPWTTLEANSEQRQPYYIGATPKEFVLEGKLADQPHLPWESKQRVEDQSSILLKQLGLSEAQFEIWPYLNDQGDPNWVFARYRKSESSPWSWLDSSDWKQRSSNKVMAPELPIVMNPHNAADATSLFSDFLTFNSLYQKPLYQEAVWTSQRGKDFLAGWISPAQKEGLKMHIAEDSSLRARILPQPARFNTDPITFIVGASKDNKLQWGEQKINWQKEKVSASKTPIEIKQPLFSPDFLSKFKTDVRILSGEEEALFPISKKKMIFSKKSSAQTDNHLGEMVDYLTERYQVLGLETRKQSFVWRGIPQSNLIAVIPGKDRTLAPLLFADHFDTAISEDHFTKTGERISNPGADDNGTATASLLRAAEELRNKKPQRDIWLLHLTGEEYPADDLGIRHFMKELLKEKKDIAGMVLIDMIGIRDPKDPIFQINSGSTAQSLALANIGMQAAKKTPSPFLPAFRGRFDDESYLYNTDGYILDNLGFPVVFFNEHLNRHTMGTHNQHYHQTTDLSENIDFDYATHISKIAITTLWNGALK
ncbi:MAG: M28 family peptidase [Bdellovibrionales bacterium]|nr:M28 family peptidase [Bdellovibrionales bacterium]